MDEDDESSVDSNAGNSDDNNQEATPSLTDEHRTAVNNGLIQAAADRGIDVAALAQQIGLSTDDINDLTDGDYLKAAEHLAAEHPDIVQNLAGRIPLVGGLIGNFLGGNR